MPHDAVFAQIPDGWQPIAALIAADGSAQTPAFARLAGSRPAPRDLADAVHCLCLLHGHRPGVVDIARDHAAVADARAWLSLCADAFAEEREWVARLIVAAGPMPSTVGQTISETAIGQQRHALEVLAASERSGCALGAAAALVIDWHDVRILLDRIGERLGLVPPPRALPGIEASRDRLRAAPLSAGQARAFHFGAQQLLAQQRGLWDLIDSRASARGAD